MTNEQRKQYKKVYDNKKQTYTKEEVLEILNKVLGINDKNYDPNTCHCLEVRKVTKQYSDFIRGVCASRGVFIMPGETYTEDEYRCTGTMEKDICHCGGDRKKCDFYKYVREEKDE